jgi:hypothetical protein
MTLDGRRMSSLAHAQRTAFAEEECLVFMAAATKVWTLEELHSLPDDGNKYELIHGELFVTPPPTDPHETIAARLTRLLHLAARPDAQAQLLHRGGRRGVLDRRSGSARYHVDS